MNGAAEYSQYILGATTSFNAKTQRCKETQNPKVEAVSSVVIKLRSGDPSYKTLEPT